MVFSPGPRVIGRTKFENWFLIWFVLWKRWSAEVFSLSFFLEEEDPEDVCDSAENDSKDCFKSPILRLEMKEEEGITTPNSKTEND